MRYEPAGDPTASESGADEPAALDWAGASNLSTCRQPEDVDAAFDRNEPHVGVAVIALVYNNTDTTAVMLRVARALTSTNPETRRQGLLALMHTARLHGQVDDVTLDLLHGLLDDRSPISGGYEVRGTAAQTVEDLQDFLTRETLPNWVNDFVDGS
ncbi:hypothetical protein AB0F73_19600 [Micromonospora purpureochromogenes]|uniref:hypothetical protein n=1 Tax=Micromonospora purpureochromogenes TaxID=47872 RepID=UPI0033C7971A